MDREYRDMVVRYLDTHHTKVSLKEVLQVNPSGDEGLTLTIGDNFTGKVYEELSFLEMLTKVFGVEVKGFLHTWLNEKYYSLGQGIYSELAKYRLKMEMDGWRVIDTSGKYVGEDDLVVELSNRYDRKLVIHFYLRWFEERVIYESGLIHKIK